ncbi:MAG TPA: BadF/BadG/BcrA/BcrD ATPase family protein [Thermoanaerobaculia bacterium]|nr:BadF/BadG/BcrA/BcrD ATPase family protein [Thermoanaerobaculia bacterium]
MTHTNHLTAGIDPGAAAVQVAVVRSGAGEDGEVLALATQRIRRRNLAEVVEAAFADACAAAGVAADAFDYVASTGDGEAVELRTGHFYSVTTHARGAAFLCPEARAAIDVGALHARALRMGEGGRVLAHKMTSQCASGSGQFVENIARYLGVPLEDVGRESLAASAPESCSSICAVLAETDVINMVSRGIATGDILKGIHLSIAGRLVKLLRSVGSDGVALVTGGLSQDEGLLAAMREVLADEKPGRGKAAPLEIRSHPESPWAGALGAALLGAYRYQQLARAGRLPASAA